MRLTMMLVFLAAAALGAEPGAAADVPLAPPPAGPASGEPVGVGDEEGEGEDGPSEVDEVRALEEAALGPKESSDAALREQLHRLGVGNALRERIEQALAGAQDSGEPLPFALDPVTDLSSFDVSRVKDRYDIPVEMQPLVAQYIHFFQHQGRRWFAKWMSRSTRYIPLMQPILVEAGLPRDTVYLAMIESGFSTSARSWAAAVGPWQFIAGTADMFGLKRDFWLDERNDYVKSTKAAARYLSQLYANHGHWYLAWAGYNTGGGRVRWITNRYGTRDFWELSTKKPGFAKETKHYVPKLIACALIAKHPEAFGFSPEEFAYEPPLEYDEVALDTQVDLDVLSRIAGTTVDELKVLNPEIKRWCTPPASAQEPYVIRVPKGAATQTREGVAKLGPAERLNFKVHRVVRGDTLSAIAVRYASAAEAIMRVNGITSARSLRLGANLLVPVPSAAAVKAGRADTGLERQVARARRSGLKTRPEDEVPAGAHAMGTAPAGAITATQVEGKTRVTYGIASGDSLWSIAQRFDVSVSDLRNWNERLPKSAYGLRQGMALTVWPGPKANLGAALPR